MNKISLIISLLFVLAALTVAVKWQALEARFVNEIAERVVAKTQSDIDSRLASEIDNKTSEMKSQIDNLREENTKLNDTTDFISKIEIPAIESTIEALHSAPTTVETDGSGYGIIQTELGPFIIEAISATPYLDGYKVRLQVGNPGTATMRGATIHVEWGLKYGDKTKDWSTINASRKKKDFDVTTIFDPGTYTYVDIFLSPAKSEEVKQIDVGIKFNVISLRRPLGQ